jgi:hypothetical protein
MWKNDQPAELTKMSCDAKMASLLLKRSTEI